MFFAGSRSSGALPVGVHVARGETRLVQLRVSNVPPAGGTGAGSGSSNNFLPQNLIAVTVRIPESDAATPDATGVARLPSPSSKPSLPHSFKQRGLVGRDVVAALPASLVHVRTFRMAPVAPAERQAALRRHAAEGSPFGAGEPLHVEVLPVGEARQGRDVREEYLAVAARDADVRGFLEGFGSGVVVRSLQAEPFAVYRSVAGAAVAADPAATHAAVHVGEFETLVLLGTGPRLRVVRRVEVGAAHLDAVVARKLSITAAEARRLRRRVTATAADTDPVRLAIHDATRPPMEEVAREAAMCVRYHAVSFRSPLPDRVRLLGCDAADPQLRSLLGAATGLPVDSRGVFDALPGWAGDDDGGWAVALGLALTYAPAVAPIAAAPTSAEPQAAAGEVACA